MARTRALITDTEREYLANKDTTPDSRYYQAVSRVRNRIDNELEEDIVTLAEHRPELLADIRTIVCEKQEEMGNESR